MGILWYYSLNLNTTGEYNVAVGYHTLSINTTGYSNTAIGFNALRNTTGPKNTGIGYSSLINTTGEQNTSIGYNSGKTNVSGNNKYKISNSKLVFFPFNQFSILNRWIY